MKHLFKYNYLINYWSLLPFLFAYYLFMAIDLLYALRVFFFNINIEQTPTCDDS
jgi:hypothetical protein